MQMSACASATRERMRITRRILSIIAILTCESWKNQSLFSSTMAVSKPERRRRKRLRAAKKPKVPFRRKLRVVVIGHSMVKGARARLRRRLLEKRRVDKDYCRGFSEQEAFPHVWNVEDVYGEIFLFYEPLVTDTDFDVALERAGRLKPDLAVLHVSSNDLAKRRLAPGQMAEKVFMSAHKLIDNHGVKEVKVLTCLPRGNGVLGSLDDFNARRVSYNSALRTLGRHDDQVSVYTVRGFERAADDKSFVSLRHLMKDLIHPNTKIGAKKYMSELRGSLLLVGGRYKQYVNPALAPPLLRRRPKLPGFFKVPKVRKPTTMMPGFFRVPKSRQEKGSRLNPARMWALAGGSVLSRPTRPEPQLAA